MGKKLFLNVLYNIGIFLCIITGYWGFGKGQYAFVAGAVFIGVVFIILKVQLLKDVRNSQKKS